MKESQRTWSGGPLYTPGASSTRRALERASARYVAYLHQLPRWLLPMVTAALLVLGLAARGWPGAIALVLVAAFLSWLAALSWPALPARSRLLRAATIACLLAVAAFQAVR
jgi:Family of unknown function (DUF6703)